MKTFGGPQQSGSSRSGCGRVAVVPWRRTDNKAELHYAILQSVCLYISMQHPAVGGYQVLSGSIPDCYTDFDKAHKTSLLMMQCQCLQRYVLSRGFGAVFLTSPRLFFDALAFLTSVRHSYRARWLFAAAETGQAFQSLLVSILFCPFCAE